MSLSSETTSSERDDDLQLRVFISYSRADMAIANRIAAALKACGIEPLIDHEELKFGEAWRKQIVSSIRQANYVLWLVSEQSIQSLYSRWELSVQQYYSKALFPVAVSAHLPERLPKAIAELHMPVLDGSDDVERQVEELAATFVAPAEWVRQHAWLTDQAHMPNGRLRGKQLIAAERWLLDEPRSKWLRQNPTFAPKPTAAIKELIVKSRRLANRRRSWIASGSVLGMVLAIMAASISFLLWQEAEVAEARSLAVASSRTTEGGDAASGVLLALKGLPGAADPWPRPSVAEPKSALYQALFSLRERTVLEGHEAPLTYAEMSPDGQRALTASEDGTARLWKLDRRVPGKPVPSTSLQAGRDVDQGGAYAVNRAVFSPDGSRIATVSDDHAATLWDADGRELARLEGHHEPLLFARFSDDARYLVTTAVDYTARLWSADSGEHQWNLRGHGGPVVEAAFSPDGKLLATASADGTARIWAIEGDGPSILLDGHEGRVTSVAFDPKGGLVATASRDNRVILWTSGGEQVRALIGHEGDVLQVRFSHDGALVVTASDDDTAKLWDSNTGREIATLTGHRSRIVDAEFSRDDTRILTASVDGAIGLWRLLRSGDNHKVERIAMMRGHERDIVSARFSADGAWILSGSRDHTARIWQATEDERFADSLDHPQDLRSLTFGKNGRLLTASKGGLIRIWDTGTRQLISERKLLDDEGMSAKERRAGQVISTAISRDGILIALAHEGGAVSLHRTAGRTIEQVGEDLDAHEMRVRTVDFSSDGKRLLTASADGTASVWDIETRREMLLLRHDGRVRSAVFSPDDGRILTVAEDRKVRLWSGEDGALLDVFDMHEDDVWAAGFSPDGKTIVTGSEDGQAFLTDTADRRSRQLVGHGDNIRSAEFSRDGRFVLTSSWDRTVRLWDAATAEELAVIPSEDIVLDAAFDPSGEQIAHLMKNLVRFRPIYPEVEDLIEAAKKKLPRTRTREERLLQSDAKAPPGAFQRLQNLISIAVDR